MRNAIKLLGMVILTCLTSCTSEKTIIFRGICIDDLHGQQGLYNPERGFRLETAVDIVDHKENPTEQLITLSHKYASDSVSLAQSYFYLTYIIGQEISDENIKTMQTYFDELERRGMKAVLRFAYEKDFMNRAPVGPRLADALAHLDQLKPFLEKNKELIFVVQAGVIGAWGEWHSSVHGLENSPEAQIAILMKLLTVVPTNKQIQVRLPIYKNLLKENPEQYGRLSFHDDFIVIKPDRWDGEMHEGTKNFQQMVDESPYLIVDGELPWGFWSIGNDPNSPSTGWIIDGLQVARRLFLQHYSSLSIIHNYKEQPSSRTFGESYDPEYSMNVWKKTWITEESLRHYKMPVSAHYFEKRDGSKAKRNVFDYIRDHLGYRIELHKLYLPQALSTHHQNSLRLELQNKGFATVHGNHAVYWVLIDANDEVTEIATSVNPFDWQPFQPGDSTYTSLTHSIRSNISLPTSLKPGNYRLGLWMPNDSNQLRYNARYAIRCANGNVTWWISKEHKYGVNLLTTINIQ